jgi:hypothetical protein
MIWALRQGRKTQTRRKKKFVNAGDLLWVKEAISLSPLGDVAYKADIEPEFYGLYKWKSPIFMPKERARIWLKVTEFSREKLQDITDDDAIAEGLTLAKWGAFSAWKWGVPDFDGSPGTDDYGWDWEDWDVDPIKAYARLWDSINGKDPDSCWSANPEISVIKFKEVECPKL